MTWATWGQIDQMLGHGARVWLSPEIPFDRSKLMVGDDYWMLFGSTNWIREAFDSTSSSTSTATTASSRHE